MSDSITIPLADFQRLIEAAKADDMLVWCESCGAWLDRDDPACATTSEYTGCWYMATGQERDKHLCRAYRSPEQYHRDNWGARSTPSQSVKEEGGE